VSTRMPGPEAARLLRLAADDIARWTLRSIADVARASGAVPVFVYHGTVGDREPGDEPILRDAADAGFVVFDILDLWRHRDHSALRIAAADNHPNAAGTRLMAARLAELIQQHRGPLGLDAGDTLRSAHGPDRQ
jgi:lysophospholipase L1-like esterase